MFGIDDAALAIGGSAVFSGLMGSSAAEEGADASREAAESARRMTRDQATMTRRDLAPYRKAGTSALARLMHLTGVGGAGGASGLGRSMKDVAAEIRSAFPGWLGGADASDEDLIRNFETNAPKLLGGKDLSGSDVTHEQMTMIQEIMGGLREARATPESTADPSADPEFGSLLRNFSKEDFEADPGYQFRLEEGEKALQRGAVARGMAKSTPGLKSLMRFSSDLASQEYGAAFGRDVVNKDRSFNYLQSIAGMGQNAAAMTGTAGMNAANAGANAALIGGQATAAGITGGAASWNNAVQGGLSNFMYQKRFDDMMKRMPVFGTPTTAGGGLNLSSYGPAMA